MTEAKTLKTSRHICLLQDYCPYCFKGAIGISSGRRVPVNSPLVDKLQVYFSAQGNGLCPLNLRKPGIPCGNHLLCRFRCLVCGKTTIDGGDDEFELFNEVCGGGPVAVTTGIMISEQMKERGLAWVERWDTPIHKKCLKKMSREQAMAVTTQAPEVSEQLKRHVVQPQTLAPVKKSPPVVGSVGEEPARKESQGITAVRYTLGKASWLPPPTMTAVSVTPGSASGKLNSRPSGSKAAVVVQAKSVKKAEVVRPKTCKAVLMEKAAEKCAFKLDTWTPHNKHPANSSFPGANKPNVPSTVFKLEEHLRLFDPDLHGPRIRNGVKGYVRYDGVFVPTPNDVNCMHADGSLTPG